MKYIILTFISISLIIIGFAIKAEAQITVKVVPSPNAEMAHKCEQRKRFHFSGLNWEAQEIGKFSDGKKLLLSKGSIDCIGGQVSSFHMLLDSEDLNLEILMHESVHMVQRDGSDWEVQAYGMTKYFFEAIDMLWEHDKKIVIAMFLNEIKKLI